ncbi:MAG TPA: hypothetical protein VJ441_00875 [Dehalococcoidia bacterium]|nr:hypothetical protein [Dehalococcoidia bacterium]
MAELEGVEVFPNPGKVDYILATFGLAERGSGSLPKIWRGQGYAPVGLQVRWSPGDSDDVQAKFAIGIAVVDYTTPQANFEAAIAAARKYGKIS